MGCSVPAFPLTIAPGRGHLFPPRAMIRDSGLSGCVGALLCNVLMLSLQVHTLRRPLGTPTLFFNPSFPCDSQAPSRSTSSSS
eukprot:343243-Pelagomonas_calceolata.AAC.3